jgi:hypothetical protein
MALSTVSPISPFDGVALRGLNLIGGVSPQTRRAYKRKVEPIRME